MPEKITPKQEDRLTDLFRNTVRGCGFSKDEAQEIIKTWGTAQTSIQEILRKFSIVDKRFGAAVEFEITIPLEYDHDKQIDAFAEKVKGQKTTYYYNADLNSKNFNKATTKLVPGKTYKVKRIPILSQVTSEDCLNRIYQEPNSILVGGQGLTVAHDLKKEIFPKGKYTVSFDKKEALWEDSGGRHRVPRVLASVDGDFEFSLGRFGRPWDVDGCLVCFCDLPVSA